MNQIYKETLEELDDRLEFIEEEFDKQKEEIKAKKDAIIFNNLLEKYNGRYFKINNFNRTYHHILENNDIHNIYSEMIIFPNKMQDANFFNYVYRTQIFYNQLEELIPITEEEFLKAKEVYNNIQDYVNKQLKLLK